MIKFYPNWVHFITKVLIIISRNFKSFNAICFFLGFSSVLFFCLVAFIDSFQRSVAYGFHFVSERLLKYIIISLVYGAEHCCRRNQVETV